MQVGLKERLIGAAVLVVIAAIVIPWVLKGNSTPGGATVSKPLALPAATGSGPVQTYRLPLNSSAATAEQAPLLPMAHTAEPAAPAMQAGNVTPGPEPQAGRSGNPVPKPQTQTTPRAPAPAATPVQRSSRSAPAPQPATVGKWVVQAGSYDSERSALAVEHKLVAHGYHAFVSRFRTKGHTYFRVRVGPYASRDDAVRAVAGVSRAADAKAAVMPNT